MFRHFSSRVNNIPPSQTGDDDFSLLHNWLDSLPLTDIRKSTKLMIAKLVMLDNSAMNKRKIFESIELLRPTINFITEALQTQFIENAELPRPQRRKIIDLAQTLQMTVSEAYCRLISHQGEYLDQAVQATCIHRAMVHITTMMLQTYQIYSPIEYQLWLKLYALYYTAEKKQLAQYKIFDNTYPELPESSIATVFAIPLLFATANPYQLRPNDILRLFNYLPLWAKDAEIHSPVEEEDLYVVSICKDSGPLSQKLLGDNENIKALRGINFTRICQHLSESLETNDKLSPSLLKHLIRSWGSFPDRAFPRQQAFGDIKVSVGLSATHYFLNNKQAITPEINTRKSASPTSAANYKQHDWQLINSSANGYCLCTAKDFPQTIEVGSIVGLQETNQDDKCYWHIGAIRWVKFTEDDECQVGIQLMAPNAMAVGVQTQQQRAQQGQYLRGLLLPELNAFSQPTTLVTPCLPYQVGNIVHLINDAVDSDVKLTACIDETQRFKQFTFEILKHFADVIRFDSDPNRRA